MTRAEIVDVITKIRSVAYGDGVIDLKAIRVFVGQVVLNGVATQPARAAVDSALAAELHPQ